MQNSHEKIIQNGKAVQREAIVIGGGLVGAVCVCILAKRGYNVTMYEKRDDIRNSKFAKGRSINLALSHRGRKALRLIGLEEEVLRNAIPMKGRFLHNRCGDAASVPYDPVTHQILPIKSVHGHKKIYRQLHEIQGVILLK